MAGFGASWRAAGELEEMAMRQESAEAPWRATSPSSSCMLADAGGKWYKTLL